ncbi:MAG TPA: hypothetical protein VLW46_00490 [Candidatus Bathyarchaeia archaeon]|nr:hypothetical protein [Candidatus Bathyarchaeia archaeon]
MKYVKSMLAGLATVVLIRVVIPAPIGFAHLFFVILLEAWKGMRTGGFGISFGPVHWNWRAPSLSDWMVIIGAFGLGFFWELRRLRRRELTALAHPSGETGS